MIIYKKGVDNKGADALSRRYNSGPECAVITTNTPQWLQEVMDSYVSDATAQALLTKLAVDPLAAPGFALKDGILCYKNRVWLGANSSLHHKIMTAFHTLAVGGHSGVPVTYRCLKQLFA